MRLPDAAQLTAMVKRAHSKFDGIERTRTHGVRKDLKRYQNDWRNQEAKPGNFWLVKHSQPS